MMAPRRLGSSSGLRSKMGSSSSTSTCSTSSYSFLTRIQNPETADFDIICYHLSFQGAHDLSFQGAHMCICDAKDCKTGRWTI